MTGNMTGNMTEGRPLKLILKFALPLFLGNLLQQTYNIIDAAIVGRILGADALAGVGASSSVQFLVLGFCSGTCCGFGVPVARSFGAENYKKMRDYVFHSMVLTAVLACIITGLCALFCREILDILSTPQDIYGNAYAYLFIIFLGIPFTLLYNLLASVLRAVGNSKTPFMFLAFSTILNIGLDLFCIVVLGWGCAGAAIATISAQAVSGVLCLIYIMKKIPLLHLKKENFRVSGKDTKTMLIMGLPMGMQFSITAIGSMVMQSANNGLGSIYVSGYTAGMKIKMFVMCPFDAIGTAVSVFCGQNLGAKKGDRVRKGVLEGAALGIIYGAVAGMVLIFCGRQLSMLFISRADVEVLDASAKYLRCLGYFYGCLGLLIVCRMCVQGLGFSGRAVFSGVTEMFARIFVSTIFVAQFGYTAICFADQAAWVSALFYIVPTCWFCVRKCLKEIKEEKRRKNINEDSFDDCRK